MEHKNHLPIFGIGPWLVAGMGLVAAVAIIFFCYVFRIGTVSGSAHGCCASSGSS